MDPTDGPDAPQALRDVLAGLGTRATATLGLPYHGELPEISIWQSEIAACFFGPDVKVINDVALAHLAAFAGGDGALILSGTGSMAWAQGPGGTHRAGGFGDLFSDEGSAFWIGREAPAMASRQIDGRVPDTGFATALCGFIGVDARQLMQWAYEAGDRRAHVAGLAKVVSALAAQGENIAYAILDKAADELSALCRACAINAGLPVPLVWAHAGGVFGDDRMVAAVTARLGSVPLACRLPPRGGAALEAAQRAGWATDEDWIRKLAGQLATQGVA